MTRASNQVLRELGVRVRALRLGRGWTLREAAERSGLSTRFLVALESGRGNISVRRLLDVARAFDTTPAALLEQSPMPASRPVVALLGLRGAGKTTVGRRLARRWRMPFVELDRRIEETAQLTLAEIFSLHGEQYYRKLELGALESVLAAAQPLVLATGGGLVTSPDALAMLRRYAITVWLRARPEDHWNRVVRQGDRRPMADHPQAMGDLRALLAAREPLYQAADHTVDTTGLTVERVVAAVERAVQRTAATAARS